MERLAAVKLKGLDNQDLAFLPKGFKIGHEILRSPES